MIKVTLNYTEEQARRVFEAQGFTVSEVEATHPPMHGDTPVPDKGTYLAVINPETQKPVPLSQAFTSLVNHQTMADLYYYDKMDVVRALSGLEPKNPFKQKSFSSNTY